MPRSQRLPSFSNLVHSVRVDLPADMGRNGHFKGQQKIAAGGGTSLEVDVVTRSEGILVSTGLQRVENQSPEGLPRWLSKQKVES
jgi:hypothetical protein